MEMARQVSLIAILFMLFVFALSLIMLKKIVNPIRNLALYAKQMTTEPSRPVPQIPGWYFELKELKRAILIAVDFLSDQTDVCRKRVEPGSAYRLL
ncbi:hypothetical protein [Cytobacillus sp. FSL H8-0458]|uniref:hypothetical protein n=1 Tax=Cytobacillus sp. FSL H8-0458 TaxID=2975346 RepID=UPI0030FC5A3C